MSQVAICDLCWTLCFFFVLPCFYCKDSYLSLCLACLSTCLITCLPASPTPKEQAELRSGSCGVRLAVPVRGPRAQCQRGWAPASGFHERTWFLRTGQLEWTRQALNELKAECEVLRSCASSVGNWHLLLSACAADVSAFLPLQKGAAALYRQEPTAVAGLKRL